MAIRRTTALVNALAKGFGVRELLRDGRIYLYSGSQPADADSAPTGTLLNVFTLANGVYTEPVKSFATITIGGSATGTLATVKVGSMAYNLLSSAVSFNGTAAQTASDVAANINARMNPLNITASASTADVILSLPFWMGAEGNSLTFATTVTGSLTATASGAFGGGTTAVNGLNFLEAVSAGVLSKEATAWQGTAVADGTAGWFRYVAGGSSYSVNDTTFVHIRFDGTVATSGGDMNISSVAITSGAVSTISTGTITESK